MLVNGKQTDSLSAKDRGLLYGDGLFETIAVVDGHPCLWSRHLARLKKDCARLGIASPDLDQLFEEASQLAKGQDRAVLKIILTRGIGGRGYKASENTESTRILSLLPWPDRPTEWKEQGVKARICDLRLGCNPLLAGIKHLNRLEQVLAQNEWSDPSIAEGVMLDAHGRVVEGTMSNLFLIKDDEVIAPDLTRCGVTGVMRGLVMDMAQTLGRSVVVGDVEVEELWQADALLFCNSIIGIWPVRQLREHTYSPGLFPVDLIAAVLGQAYKP